MGWLEDLRGQVVGLDTAPLIYYLDGRPDYKEILHPFFTMVNNRGCSIATSVVTLLEGLVLPKRKNDEEWERRYYNFLFSTNGVKTYNISANIAERAAQIRATYKDIKALDAIQIATAISARASAFLTNDAQLSYITEIKVLVLKDLKLDS